MSVTSRACFVHKSDWNVERSRRPSRLLIASLPDQCCNEINSSTASRSFARETDPWSYFDRRFSVHVTKPCPAPARISVSDTFWPSQRLNWWKLLSISTQISATFKKTNEKKTNPQTLFKLPARYVGHTLKTLFSSLEATIKVRFSREQPLTLSEQAKLLLLLWLRTLTDGRTLRQRHSGMYRKSVNEEHERVPGTSEPHSYSCRAWHRSWKHPKISKWLLNNFEVTEAHHVFHRYKSRDV